MPDFLIQTQVSKIQIFLDGYRLSCGVWYENRDWVVVEWNQLVSGVLCWQKCFLPHKTVKYILIYHYAWGLSRHNFDVRICVHYFTAVHFDKLCPQFPKRAFYTRATCKPRRAER